MAKNISLMGASYSDVPAVTLPQTGGGTARFDDASVTTATAADVAQGKVFLAADGTITTGTASGGGSIVVVDTPDGHGGTIREITATNVTTLVEKTITQNGTYDPSNDNADGYSSVTVNVGGGITADQIAERTISGVVEGSAATIGSYAFYNCSQITGASFPNAEIIGDQAFSSCASLSFVSFPNVTGINSSAFYNCHSLAEANFPSATYIYGYAFARCFALSQVSLPEVKRIFGYAFMECSNLQTVDLPEASTIGASAFGGCSNLQTVNLPKASSIGINAFYNCSRLSFVSCPSFSGIIQSGTFDGCYKLKTAYLPSATGVGSCAFRTCYSLYGIVLSSASVIYSQAFQSCGLRSMYFPMVKTIYSSAFAYCSYISMASLPELTAITGSSVFYRCYRLVSLYLLGSSVATLGVADAFSSTPIGGYTNFTDGVLGNIYVPSSLYSSYRTAPRWSSFATRFVSVEGDE